MTALPPGIALPLLALVLTAAVTDIRSRRIPNWLTLAGVVLGFGLNAIIAPSVGSGLLFALLGCAVAFGVNVLFYALRFTGAGDVKLMAAVGALVGWKNWIGIFILNGLAGGVLALAIILFKGRLRRTFSNLGFAVYSMAHLRAPYRVSEELDVTSPKAMRLPRGVVIAAGVVLFIAISSVAAK